MPIVMPWNPLSHSTRLMHHVALLFSDILKTTLSPVRHTTPAHTVLGFPFETIQSEDARNTLMAQIMNFFTTPEGVHPNNRTKIYPENIIGQEARPLTRSASPRSRNLDPREIAESESSRRGKEKNKQKGNGNSQKA